MNNKATLDRILQLNNILKDCSPNGYTVLSDSESWVIFIPEMILLFTLQYYDMFDSILNESFPIHALYETHLHNRIIFLILAFVRLDICG